MRKGYWGCEIESKLYLEVEQDMKMKKAPYSFQNNNNTTKRGKHKKK